MIRREPLLYVVIGVMLARLITMATLPMFDTSEPRYAEMARLMWLTNNWITPWFAPEVPFWGKPPLSIWTQVLSINVLGFSDFAIRFPSWVITAAMMWLIFKTAATLYDHTTALWSVAIFTSFALVHMTAGAVLMDPALALSATMIFTGMFLTKNGETGFWRWAPFVGVSIGLLSKGPVILALLALPGLMALLFKEWRSVLVHLPWFTGVTLVCLLVFPWYVLAELSTPGFLNYFLIGEHFLRFTDPGWEGDLYGSAHDEPIGAIWIEGIQATAPWSLIFIPAALWRLRTSKQWRTLTTEIRNPNTAMLLAAGLSPFLFFTFSRNILWTYVLPGLPFLAMLLARFFMPSRGTFKSLLLGLTVIAFPVIALTLGSFFSVNPEKLRSTYSSIEAFKAVKTPENAKLFYYGSAPFSAWYYSRRNITEIKPGDLDPRLRTRDSGSKELFFLLRSRDFAEFNNKAMNYGEVEILHKTDFYILLRISLRTP